VALALGTQFPDLIDKPLAWNLGVLPNGRSLAHSLLTATLVVLVLQVLLRRRRRGAIATAFAVGYVSHLFGDALYPLLARNYDNLAFLAWPIAPAIQYSPQPGLLVHLRYVSLRSFYTIEGGLALLVFALWLYDGRPGLGVVTAVPRWVGRKLSV
jgi:membrane-bound metal-dependent hydrolase YbcI (DUF457 family)